MICASAACNDIVNPVICTYLLANPRSQRNANHDITAVVAHDALMMIGPLDSQGFTQ
jgi:hypothetical protein